MILSLDFGDIVKAAFPFVWITESFGCHGLYSVNGLCIGTSFFAGRADVTLSPSRFRFFDAFGRALFRVAQFCDSLRAGLD